LKNLLEKDSFFISLLLFLWLLVILIVNPVGEFAINDDWAYSKNVKSLVVDHQFVVDSWPAMNLVSQTAYGSLFAFVFGFSFTILRLSMLFLSILCSVTLYNLLRKFNEQKILCFLLVCSVIFNPLFLSLSFTFMTDIFFLSFIVFTINSLVNFLRNQKTRDYILFCFFCLIAVMCRQQGLLLPIILALPLIRLRMPLFRKIIIMAFPFLLSISAHLGYRKILDIYWIYFTSNDLSMLLNYFKSRDLQSIVHQTGTILLTMGLILLPLIPVLLGRLPKPKSFHLLIFIPSACIVIWLAVQSWNNFPAGNIFNFNGIGAKILKDQTVNTKLMPSPWIVTAIKTLSLASILTYLYFFFSKISHLTKIQSVTSSVTIFAIMYFFFLFVNSFFFDRHSLPILGITLFLVGASIHSVSRTKLYLLASVVVLLVIFSTLSVKDYMNWQRTRYAAIASLNKKGIDAHYIDGGFEYNGWHKPGEGYATDGRSWWWVDRDDYLISGGNYPGYTIHSSFTYRHYLPLRTDTVYVLKKQQP